MAETDNTEPTKDIPPWLQPVPETEDEGGMFSSGRMKLIAVGIAALVVIVFVAAIVVLYRDAPSEGPRHIAAETAPIRERPDEAGGLKVDHQDKAVLEIGDGTPATSRVQIGVQPEQPVKEIPDLPEETAAAVAESQDTIGDLAEAALDTAEKQAAPAPAPTQAQQSQPAQQPVATTPASEPVTESAEGQSAQDQYRVQLGAYGSEQSAATAWRVVRGKFQRELGDLSPVYVPVQSGDRTLYRLRVGMLATRAEADAVCIALRTQQQACFVINP